MKYIYGPVKSRRLGLSLGLSLTQSKTCNFDCVYCQLGGGGVKTQLRKEYVAIGDILDEFRAWLRDNPQEISQLDYITLSGSGEPTLNARIGELITEIKKLCAVPVALITNAALLSQEAVRRQVESADLVVPSLDAVTPEVFARINRPLPEIRVENVIAGLIALRQEYKGKIWLEVMVVSGVNDDLRHIRKLQEYVELIRPDKIQLNSPVRATAVEGVSSADKRKLEKIKEILGDRAEII